MTALFDPDEVATRLASLPRLAPALGDPHLEGECSTVFAQARKSAREIYRVLGNVHFQHLDELVQALDFCLEGGFTQPTILRTRARKSFAESLAELHAAEHFLLRKFEVEPQDTTKGSEPVPDFIARGHGTEVAVEVYCPRAWEGLSDLLDDLKDVIKNLDVPYDYAFKVRIEQLEHFTADDRLLTFHPGELAAALTPTVRESIILGIRDDLAAKLARAVSHGSVHGEWERPDLNIGITIALESGKGSRGRLPSRQGIIEGPSTSGYAPEGMFDRLVLNNVRKKAKKGQAAGHASLSLLLVDLSCSELTRELLHPSYRPLFLQTVDTRLGSDLGSYDFIAFCDAPAWRRELRLHFLKRGHQVNTAGVRLFFGEQAFVAPESREGA